MFKPKNHRFYFSSGKLINSACVLLGIPQLCTLYKKRKKKNGTSSLVSSRFSGTRKKEKKVLKAYSNCKNHQKISLSCLKLIDVTYHTFTSIRVMISICKQISKVVSL